MERAHGEAGRTVDPRAIVSSRIWQILYEAQGNGSSAITTGNHTLEELAQTLATPTGDNDALDEFWATQVTKMQEYATERGLAIQVLPQEMGQNS